MSSRSGFSLLELLVALALLAGIAAGLASSMRLGLAVYQSASNPSPKGELAANRARLRHYLSRATADGTFFAGRPDILSFRTNAPIGSAALASTTEVSVMGSDDGSSVFFRFLDDADRLMDSHEIPLSNEAGLEFEYFGLQGRKTAWSEDWEKGNIPALVRMRVPGWPEMTVNLIYAN